MNTSTDYRNDINSLIKDIVEREKIISDYKKYGILDRDKAINKIQELRIKDKEVEKVTTANLAISSIPFYMSSDEQIVAELDMQKGILEAKLSALQKSWTKSTQRAIGLDVWWLFPLCEYYFVAKMLPFRAPKLPKAL